MSQYVQSKIAARASDVGRRFPLARHLIEMYLAMQVGMAAGSLSLAVVIGTSVAETRRQHPVAFLLVMALSMTLPMAAWMLHRGHSRRRAGEMAAAMLAPALPLIGLQLSHVITASGCGAYMTLSTIAMITLVVYRRNEYRTAAAAHARAVGSRTTQLR